MIFLILTTLIQIVKLFSNYYKNTVFEKVMKNHLLLASIFSFIVLFSSYLQAHSLDEESVFNYNGIPGCRCFYHCSCFHYDIDTFKQLSREHGSYPEDEVWHTFVQEALLAIDAGPSLEIPCDNLNKLVGIPYGNEAYTCMLSDYFERVEEIKNEVERARKDWIKFVNQFLTSKSDEVEREKRIARFNTRALNALGILDGISNKLIPLYKKILDSCSHQKPYNLAFYYNRGLISFLERDYASSVYDIRQLLDSAQGNKLRNKLDSKTHCLCGEAFLECGMYLEAIESLNDAIKADQKNKEAYFLRATAYFETGEFEQSIKDFLESDFCLPRIKFRQYRHTI